MGGYDGQKRENPRSFARGGGASKDPSCIIYYEALETLALSAIASASPLRLTPLGFTRGPPALLPQIQTEHQLL